MKHGQDDFSHWSKCGGPLEQREIPDVAWCAECEISLDVEKVLVLCVRDEDQDQK
jgi:hypothetical protein